MSDAQWDTYLADCRELQTLQDAMRGPVSEVEALGLSERLARIAARVRAYEDMVECDVCRALVSPDDVSVPDTHYTVCRSCQAAGL